MEIIKEKFFGIIDKITFIKKCMRKLGIRDADQIKSKIRTIYVNNEKPAD